MPKNTDNYGRDEVGKFAKGNPGKPKGATHRTTKELRESIVHFLLDKAELMYEIWDTLEPKDQATLFLHLSKLVMPPMKPEQELEKKDDLMKIIITRRVIGEDGIERLEEYDHRGPTISVPD